jgi:imidazole glycerol-phosphate synthase subunit HisF
MLQIRVIPCLLLKNGSLVKTIKFENPSYVGDASNAIRIFNEKAVDELVVLDIEASRCGAPPSFADVAKFTSECFMPIAYGGGVTTVNHMRELYRMGVEKVVLNTSAFENQGIVSQAADQFGSQAVVCSIDARRKGASWETFTRGGTQATGLLPAAAAEEFQRLGCGEILLTSVDQDGTMGGYDLELIESVARSVDVPVIANGGAGCLADFGKAVNAAGAAAVAIGSMAVYFGRNRAVLINFPSPREIQRGLQSEK